MAERLARSLVVVATVAARSWMTLPTAVVTTDAALPAVTTKEAAVTPRAVTQIVVVETALVLVAADGGSDGIDNDDIPWGPS